jgi:ATP-dependent metalloprotease
LRFADVLGIEEHMEELLEIVDFLQWPDDYIEAGATLPKGLLLTGAPGVGKTMLARALVGEANCSFFYAPRSEFNEVFFGMGAIRVKKFVRGREGARPCCDFY